jgi:hypothetical protein
MTKPLLTNREENVNGNRNLTIWRQVKIDHLPVYVSSVAAVGTRPRSRSLSR